MISGHHHWASHPHPHPQVSPGLSRTVKMFLEFCFLLYICEIRCNRIGNNECKQLLLWSRMNLKAPLEHISDGLLVSIPVQFRKNTAKHRFPHADCRQHEIWQLMQVKWICGFDKMVSSDCWAPLSHIQVGINRWRANRKHCSLLMFVIIAAQVANEGWICAGVFLAVAWNQRVKQTLYSAPSVTHLHIWAHGGLLLCLKFYITCIHVTCF